MTTATIPDLKGFETYYGLKVSDIGEDGNVLILGHHHHDPLRVVAALNRHARTFWGLRNLIDERDALLGDLVGALIETYAVVESFDADGDWYIRWDVDQAVEGAFPATVWRP